jgi:type IV pilus assembly protein PilN
MRVPINLASHPLENLRPVRAAVVAAALVAAVLGILLLNRELRSRTEFRSLIQEQAELESSLRGLTAQQQELEAALSTTEAQQIRERSGFMNSLILRKSLSWTQLFMDLEKTLPASARITAIQPQLNATEDVDLNLTVAAASMEPLVEFLKNLESSTEFGPPVVGSQRYLTERSAESGIELAVTTRYVQNRTKNLPAGPKPDSAPVQPAAVSADTGSQEGGTAEEMSEELLPEVDSAAPGEEVP